MNRTESIISRFPHFYQSGEEWAVLFRYIETFARLVDGAEDDLRKVMRAHWVNTADNEGSKGFDAEQKGDLDKIFSLYLASLGGTSQLKQTGRREGTEGLEDDAIYRERIKGLIQVLLNGASTKTGIIDIVAANLGIVGESEEAIAAKKLIRVIEFQPKVIGNNEPIVLKPFQQFTIDNPNPTISGAEIRFSIHDSFNLNVTKFVVRQISGNEGQFFGYDGGLTKNDQLVITEDGRVRKNAVLISDDILGRAPQIPVGQSKWVAEIFAELPAGRFDEDYFSLAAFDTTSESFPGLINAFDVLEIEVNLLSIQPASFTVRIPWDIPGYTEILDNLADKPRNQIPYIVNKVKAAGVYAEVEYFKTFRETHEMAEEIVGVEIGMLGEEHAEVHDLLEGELNIGTIQQPDRIDHNIEDTFIHHGVFDYTTFDSLNTFA